MISQSRLRCDLLQAWVCIVGALNDPGIARATPQLKGLCPPCIMAVIWDCKRRASDSPEYSAQQQLILTQSIRATSSSFMFTQGTGDSHYFFDVQTAEADGGLARRATSWQVWVTHRPKTSLFMQDSAQGIIPTLSMRGTQVTELVMQYDYPTSRSTRPRPEWVG